MGRESGIGPPDSISIGRIPAFGDILAVNLKIPLQDNVKDEQVQSSLAHSTH